VPIFLGCASVFQERQCGGNQTDEVCNALDALAFVIFLLAIVGCLINPLRLGYLALRERSRPSTNFFLSAAAGAQTRQPHRVSHGLLLC